MLKWTLSDLNGIQDGWILANDGLLPRWEHRSVGASLVLTRYGWVAGFQGESIDAKSYTQALRWLGVRFGEVEK